MTASPATPDMDAGQNGPQRISTGSGQQGPVHTGMRPGSDRVLARFIRLCSAVLATPVPQEAAALIVNRIAEIAPMDRAVLVRLHGKGAIQAVTGGGKTAQDSRFADAVESVRKQYRDRQTALILPPAADGGRMNAALHTVQSAMGGTQILWLPLWMDREGTAPPAYALWLERWRNRPWEKSDVELLGHAALFMAHGLARPRAEANRSRKRWVRSAAALLLILLMALPVTSNVTAPVRVAPDRPHHIFAPMDGILKELHVQPGQWVKKDDVLFRYDARVLEKRLDEAHRNVAVARAKLAKLEGAAHRDREARAELPVQRLEVERAEADAAFYARQRSRAAVRSGQAGVVVLDDPDALVGAALQTGQAVLSVADPDRTKLRLWVPASDVGFIRKGARAAARLDSAPFRSIPAVIARVGFDIQLSPEGVPSVMAEAIWTGEGAEVQPGQKGAAKIYGDSTFLGMQILRKPLIALRSLIGF